MRQYRYRFTCPFFLVPLSWARLTGDSAKRAFAVRACCISGPVRQLRTTIDNNLARRHSASAADSIRQQSGAIKDDENEIDRIDDSLSSSTSTATKAPENCDHHHQQQVAVERAADFLSQGRVANCLRRMHTSNNTNGTAHCSLDVAIRLLISHDEARTKTANAPSTSDASSCSSLSLLDQHAFAELKHPSRIWKAEAPLELVLPTAPSAGRQSTLGSRRRGGALAAGGSQQSCASSVDNRNPVCPTTVKFLAVGYGLSERCAVAAAAMHAERLIDASGLHLYALPRMQERHALEVRSRGRWAPLPTEGPQHSPSTGLTKKDEDQKAACCENELPSLLTKPQCVIVTQPPDDGKSDASRVSDNAASLRPSTSAVNQSHGHRTTSASSITTTTTSSRGFDYRIRTGRSLDFFSSYSHDDSELHDSKSSSVVNPLCSIKEEVPGTSSSAPHCTGPAVRDNSVTIESDPMFAPYGDEGGGEAGRGASHAQHHNHYYFRNGGNSGEGRAPSWNAVRDALGHRGGDTGGYSEIHADEVKILSPDSGPSSSSPPSSSSSSSRRYHHDNGATMSNVNRRSHSSRLPDNLMHREKPFLPNRHVSKHVLDASEGGVFDLVEDGDAWVAESDAPLPYMCIRDPGALRRMTDACQEAFDFVMTVSKAACSLTDEWTRAAMSQNQEQQLPTATVMTTTTTTGAELFRSLVVLQPVDTMVDHTSSSRSTSTTRTTNGGKMLRSAEHEYCTWYTAKISVDDLATWLLLCQAATACQETAPGGSPVVHHQSTTRTDVSLRVRVASALMQLLEEQQKRTGSTERSNDGDKRHSRSDSSADLKDATIHCQDQPTSSSSTETGPDDNARLARTVRLVAEGKGPTCVAALELCAMHAERLLEQLGVPLFPANPAKSQVVEDACLRYGRSRGQLLFATSHEVARWLDTTAVDVARFDQPPDGKRCVDGSSSPETSGSKPRTTRDVEGLVGEVTRRLETRMRNMGSRLQKPLKLFHRKEVNRPTTPRSMQAEDDDSSSSDAASAKFVDSEHRARHPAAPSISSSSSSGSLARGCPLSPHEVMLALHRRVIATNRIHGIELDVDHSWDLLLSAEAAVSAYMRRQTANVGAAELPILIARYSQYHFRASMFLPVPSPRYGIRGGYAVGLSPRSARALCALHALDVLCALGIPALSDSGEQRAMIEERRKRGLVVPAAATTRTRGDGGGGVEGYVAQPTVLSPPAYREVNGGSLTIPHAHVTWSLLALDASEFDVCRDAPPPPSVVAANEQQQQQRKSETHNGIVAASYGNGVGELDALRRLVHALVFELAGWTPETLVRNTQVLVAAQHLGPRRRLAANNSWFELPLHSGGRSPDRRLLSGVGGGECSSSGGNSRCCHRYFALGRCITKKGSERAMLIHALRIAVFLDLPELRYIIDGGHARRPLRQMFDAFCSLHIHGAEGGRSNDSFQLLRDTMHARDRGSYPNPVMSTQLALETFKR